MAMRSIGAGFFLVCLAISSGAFLFAHPAVGEEAAQTYTRTTGPRILPLDPSKWTDVERKALGKRAESANVADILKICVRNAGLCASWMPLAGYIESVESGLTRRERELLIGRTAWLSGDAYNYNAHLAGLVRAGEATEEEVPRVGEGPNAKGWTPHEKALLQAADELHASQFITDATWKKLTEKFNDSQMMSVIFTCGQYTLAAMLVNSAAVPLPPGSKKLPFK